MNNPLTVEVYIEASRERVWNCFTNPDDIIKWNAASEDWHTPRAENDLRVGGKFSARMEAKDGSEGFDFNGVYDAVTPHEYIAYTMEGGRKVDVKFMREGEGVRLVETFEPETENPLEMQRAGWQSILENFKRYVEKSVL